MSSQHKTGSHPFYIGMYIHIYTHIYVHIYTSQKECLHIFSHAQFYGENLANFWLIFDGSWWSLMLVNIASKLGFPSNKLTWKWKILDETGKHRLSSKPVGFSMAMLVYRLAGVYSIL